VFFKLLEKLIKSRLEKFTELDLLLSPSQFDFRKGRSCDDYISLMVLEVYKGFINHDPVGVLLLDIKGIYDNVKPNILFDIINNIRIPIHYKVFIRNLISHRYASTNLANFFIRALFIRVCLSSSLSPLLFNLYIKDILNHIPYDCKTIQFADDIVLICLYRDLNKITNSLQEAYNQIQIWVESIGLELSLTKSQFVVFHRSKTRLTSVG